MDKGVVRGKEKEGGVEEAASREADGVKQLEIFWCETSRDLVHD